MCVCVRTGERQGQPKRRMGPEVTGEDAWNLWSALCCAVTFHISLPFKKCGFLNNFFSFGERERDQFVVLLSYAFIG